MDALNTIANAIDAYRASGGECLCPSFLGQYGEACLRQGRYDTGLQAVDEGLAMMTRNGEYCWEPELLRVRALLLAAAEDNTAQAEEMLRLAMTRGMEIGAVMPALNAGIDYARIVLARGDAATARSVLDTALAPFARERDHAGVQRARELWSRL